MPVPEAPTGLGRILRSTAILLSGTAVAQVIAFGRELFVASQAGLSLELDALLVALALPLIVSGALTSGLGTALVPALSDARSGSDASVARRLAGVVLTWAAIGGAVGWVALVALGEPIVRVAGIGLPEAARADAQAFIGLLAPLAVIGTMQGTLGAICQAGLRFRAISLSVLAQSVISLATTVLLWEPLGVAALAVGHVLGALGACALLMAGAARTVGLPRPALFARGVGLRALVRHATPLSVSATILQLNIVADRAVASLLGAGSVSALRYGETIVRTPIAALAPAWGSAIYPTLAHEATRERQGEGGARTTLPSAVRLALIVFVPMAVGVAAVAPAAVALAFGRGAFAADAVATTSGVVVGFAPLMVALMVSPVLTAAHNAQRRGTLLLVTGGTNAVLNLGLNLAFGALIGPAGVALSTSLTGIVVTLFVFGRLPPAERGDSRAIGHALRASIAAALVPAIPLAIAGWTVTDDVARLLVLLVGGPVFLAVYVALMVRFGVPEAGRILAWIRRT